MTKNSGSVELGTPEIPAKWPPRIASIYLGGSLVFVLGWTMFAQYGFIDMNKDGHLCDYYASPNAVNYVAQAQPCRIRFLAVATEIVPLTVVLVVLVQLPAYLFLIMRFARNRLDGRSTELIPPDVLYRLAVIYVVATSTVVLAWSGSGAWHLVKYMPGAPYCTQMPDWETTVRFAGGPEGVCRIHLASIAFNALELSVLSLIALQWPVYLYFWVRRVATTEIRRSPNV